MKGPPLQRSLIFWAGLFVLASILWGWVDSRSMMTGSARSGFAVISTRSEVMLIQSPTTLRRSEALRRPRGPGDGSDGDWFTSLRLIHGGELGPRFLIGETESSRDETLRYIVSGFLPDEWLLLLPYWLIFLTALLLWLAVLAARDRQYRRARRLVPVDTPE